MNKPLTERKALIITRDLWLWLAKHPGNTKEWWPGWKKKKIGKMKQDCPCCEYAWQQVRQDVRVDMCTKCPLAGKWSKVGVIDSAECASLGSPYDKWVHAPNFSAEIKYAKQIAALASKALKALKGKKKS